MAESTLDLDQTVIEVEKTLEIAPVESYRCYMNGIKYVSIRKQLDSDDRDLVWRLSYHENILNPVIPYASFQNKNFIVCEDFLYSLQDSFVPWNLKCLVFQICKGLLHYHKSGLVLDSINALNIIKSIVFDSENRPKDYLYKITHIGRGVHEATQELVEQNVRDLGHIVGSFHSNFNEFYKDMLSVSDGLCAVDLFDSMIEERHSMHINMKHPFFWSIHDSLMFIVEIVKMLEPAKEKKDFESINNFLKSCGTIVLSTKDWREDTYDLLKYLATEKMDKLIKPPKKTNGEYEHKDLIKHMPKRNLYGLLQTIRNMTCHNSFKLKDIIGGQGEEAIYNYFMTKFPKLILALYRTNGLECCIFHS